jgi:hypothetical protein
LPGFVSRVPFLQRRLQDACSFFLDACLKFGVFSKLVELSRNVGFRNDFCQSDSAVLAARSRSLAHAASLARLHRVGSPCLGNSAHLVENFND